MNQITTTNNGNQNDLEYDSFLVKMRMRFDTLVEADNEPVFTTAANNLWEVYLNSFTDPAERQYHNCHCCRRFIEKYGGLVKIATDGRTTSVMWDPEIAPPQYQATVARLQKIVENSKVTGVFYSSAREWGNGETGIWKHFSVIPAATRIFKHPVHTARQAMAEKHEDYKNIKRAIVEFSVSTLDVALKLLQTDSLYRSEKVLGACQWLRDLQIAYNHADSRNRSAIVWRAVALAPAGFCHPRSGMIGTLLEDIEAGKGYEEVAASFAAKMHPLRYQRPSAEPNEGQIEAAEKLVASLGVANSLKRRFARMEDIDKLWEPKIIAPPEPTGGVFDHLKNKSTLTPDKIQLPPTYMSWEKFQRTVLPTAERIQFHTPLGGPYMALVTAEDMSAPPILQWDKPEKRNPVSWYFWNGGAPVDQFKLPANKFVEVSALTLKPSMWYDGNFPHQGVGVMFVLEGARETRIAGSALFPEILKAEYHGIRSVIEAHSRKDKISGKDEPHVAGYMFTNKKLDMPVRIRVLSAGWWQEYVLDRWD